MKGLAAMLLFAVVASGCSSGTNSDELAQLRTEVAELKELLLNTAAAPTTTVAPATTQPPPTNTAESAHVSSLDPIEFDVENATFDVCISPWRDGGPVSFTDGGWEDEIYDDDPLDDWAGRPGGFAWVTEVAIGELVEESPGPEVLAEIGCSGGGSHTNYQVQVFAGNTSEPRRLGRILYHFVEDHADTELHFKYGSENTITTRMRVWQGYDAHCCPSKYVLTNYKWTDGDWAETHSEAWIMESWMIKAWERESKKAESQ